MKSRDKGVGRGLSIIVCTMLLSGCALPVPVQIASWALDGISFLTTEKSLTDHGISMVTKKDCALWRGLKGDEICSENDDAGTFAIAANSPAETDDTERTNASSLSDGVAALAEFDTAAGSPEIALAKHTQSRPAAIDGQRLMIVGKRVWSERLDADIYSVIGSFSNRGNARRLVEKHRALGPAVMASRLDGIEVYRVAVGPYSADQKSMMRKVLKKAGIGNAWAMRVDHRDWMLASPKELLAPEKSVAEVPAKPEDVKPAPKPEASQEVAETPNDETISVPSSRLIEDEKRYLVIGSFSSANNARNYAKTKADLSPRILSANTAEGWRHRVVIGPYGEDASLRVRRELRHMGIEQAWALKLNPDDIISDTLLAEDPDLDQDQVEELGADEVAEVPGADADKSTLQQKPETKDSGDEMSWGVNLVKNIINMFSSPDTTDIVRVISALES